MLVLAHVTHEAVEKIGGIGAVLEGLLDAASYRKAVGRNVLIGPLFSREGDLKSRLGRTGTVLYSSLDGYDSGGWAGKFRPIELAYGVGIVYGKRVIADPLGGSSVEAEALLIDVKDYDLRRLNTLKARFFTKFNLNSMPHEQVWDFEQYMRLAEPGYYGLHALGLAADDKCVVISHEYMGMPLALTAELEKDPRFGSMYYVHETPIVRKLVEDQPGHDTGFYNVMNHAEKLGLSLEQVYGGQEGFFKHALLLQSKNTGAVLAVGDVVERELRFIDRAFDGSKVHLCFNGIPARKASAAEIKASKTLLQDYSQELVGFRPDYVMTHVTRPVMSKAIWRDLLVLHNLDPLLAAERKRAVMFILTSAGGVRSEHDVRRMEQEYGWPMNHRLHYPDLVGPEVGLSDDCDGFNRRHEAIKVVFVNQFGWSREACGARMPAGMTFLDLRKGAEVEFGQSVYEPFGISQLEALCFGAICVATNVCGCVGFVKAAAKNKPVDNLLIADYVAMPTEGWDLNRLLRIGRDERDGVEMRVSGEVARELHRRLPRDEKQSAKLQETGYALAQRMGWETVFTNYFQPAMTKALAKK